MASYGRLAPAQPALGIGKGAADASAVTWPARAALEAFWVPPRANLRFPKSRHPRLQDCRLRWRAAAELRRAASLAGAFRRIPTKSAIFLTPSRRRHGPLRLGFRKAIRERARGQERRRLQGLSKTGTTRANSPFRAALARKRLLDRPPPCCPSHSLATTVS
jgi:hypothetical protein